MGLKNLRAEAWTAHEKVTVVMDDETSITGKRVVAECDTEEHATLFAAAPDLLEAAEESTECEEILCNLMDSIKSHGNYSVESTLIFLSQAQACLANLSSAIAKASGKAA